MKVGWVDTYRNPRYVCLLVCFRYDLAFISNYEAYTDTPTPTSNSSM